MMQIQKIKFLLLGLFSFLMILIVSCSEDPEDNGVLPDDPEFPDEELTIISLNVDTESTHQTIAGFGGASRMWGTRFLTEGEAQSTFGLGEDELGMSIFRIRIASNPDEWPNIVQASQYALSHGAIILASPWSPPAALKSNESDIGGHLLPENYAAYRDHINAFIEYMESQNVDIYAISIQNEPDIEVSYESCDWTPSQMADFLRDYGSTIEGAKVVAAESFNFNQGFTNVLLNDTDVEPHIDIVGGHIYGSGQRPYPLAEEKNKEIWMTEYLMNLNTGNAGAPEWTTYSEAEIWEESLGMLETIHNAMINNWNAYIWWYIRRYYSFLGDNTQGTTDGTVLKRGYGFSHFSKFVRPGFIRVDIGIDTQTNLLATAFVGENQTVVNIINPTSSLLSNIDIAIDGSTPESASVYSTSASVNQEMQTISMEEEMLLLSIGPRTVTTIVIND
jgi:glucuronoarabinoxylan endo-1,4-beta-xylanase